MQEAKKLFGFSSLVYFTFLLSSIFLYFFSFFQLNKVKQVQQVFRFLYILFIWKKKMMCSSKRCLRVSFASKKLFGESFFSPSLNISRKSNIWFFGYDKVFFASGCTSYLEISETYFCSRGGSSRSD